MSRCTAPIKGHRKPGSEANCPVHGAPTNRAFALVERLRPSLPGTLIESGLDTGLRSDLASDRRAPDDLLARLAGDASGSVREVVAANPSTPVEALLALAGDTDWRVYEKVAANRAAPDAALARLAGDASWTTRGAVANNPTTPAGVLVTLARDGNEMVRVSVAKNPSTPGEVLSALAGEENTSRVRSTAANLVRARISARLGIDESNTGAIDVLREQAWWEMSPDDPAVVLTKTLHPNA